MSVADVMGMSVVQNGTGGDGGTGGGDGGGGGGEYVINQAKIPLQLLLTHTWFALKS